MIRSFVRSLAVAVATTSVAVAAAAASQALPGDQSRWSLDFRARMEQPSAPPIEVRMIGDWTSTITAVHDGEYDAQLQLANVHVTSDSSKNAPAASLAGLQARLSQPFWVTYRSDGGLAAIHFFRDMHPSDRNLLQMIATELQLVRPDSARNSWTAQERDGAGEYSALYLMPQPDRILKRKLKYLYTDGVAGAPAGSLQVHIDQSDVTFSLTPDRRVREIDGTSRMRMDLSADQAQQLAALTEFHATNLRTGLAPELIGSLERALPNVSSSAIVTQKPDAAVARAEADQRLLKGDTTTALLDAAFVKDAAKATPADRLTALFRSRPDAAQDAVGLLYKNGRQRSVTNALGAAGSPSAVVALSSLAHDTTLAGNLRVDAILGFVQMQHPSADAMRVPGDLVRNSNAAVQSAARMISGALSRAGREEHPAEADAIDASLNTLYREAADAREKTELLGALGNSAGPSTVPAIVEALHDSRIPIRAAAARALRLAAGSDVDRLLATVISSDSDAAVRADAIFATRFRHRLSPPLADALLHAASTDTATYVRGDAVSVLRQNLTASLRIPEVLAQIAQSDPDAGIRRQAKNALADLSPAESSRP
jgi:hypothetical protein